MRVLDFEKERKYMEIARNLTQEEAIRMMLTNPEILEPVVYIFFSIGAKVKEVLPHTEYCALMKKKAIETNNKELLRLVKKYEGAL